METAINIDRNDEKTAQPNSQDMATTCSITKQEGMNRNEMSSKKRNKT